MGQRILMPEWTRGRPKCAWLDRMEPSWSFVCQSVCLSGFNINSVSRCVWVHAYIQLTQCFLRLRHKNATRKERFCLRALLCWKTHIQRESILQLNHSYWHVHTHSFKSGQELILPVIYHHTQQCAIRNCVLRDKHKPLCPSGETDILIEVNRKSWLLSSFLSLIDW